MNNFPQVSQLNSKGIWTQIYLNPKLELFSSRCPFLNPKLDPCPDASPHTGNTPGQFLSCGLGLGVLGIFVLISSSGQKHLFPKTSVCRRRSKFLGLTSEALCSLAFSYFFLLLPLSSLHNPSAQLVCALSFECQEVVTMEKFLSFFQRPALPPTLDPISLRLKTFLLWYPLFLALFISLSFCSIPSAGEMLQSLPYWKNSSLSPHFPLAVASFSILRLSTPSQKSFLQRLSHLAHFPFTLQPPTEIMHIKVTNNLHAGKSKMLSYAPLKVSAVFDRVATPLWNAFFASLLIYLGINCRQQNPP